MSERALPLTPEQGERLASARLLKEAAETHARSIARGILLEHGVGRAELLRVEQHDEGVVLVVRER